MKSHFPIRLGLTVLLLATLCGTRAALAAPGDHVWSTGFDYAGLTGDAAVDSSGNIAAVGTFFDTVDFGGGPITAVHPFGGDVYVVQFDGEGQHLWTRQFTPVGGNGVTQPQVTRGPAGEIYLSGWIMGSTLDLGGGPIAGTQSFLAKLDAAGNHVWSLGVGGARIYSLDADATHLAVAGYKDTSVPAGADFGGGPIGLAGGNDAVVAELTNGGAHVWSRGFGDALGQAAFGVSIDGAGNVALAGSMFGTVDFGNGPRAANGLDAFLASFTGTGVPRWDKVFNGTFTNGGGVLVTLGLDADAGGDIALCGQFSGTVNFGGGVLTSAGFGDAFAARFDPAGTHLWSRRFGSNTGTDVGRSIELDRDGNALFTGSFTGRTTLGGDTLIATGGSSLFAAMYDSAGTHVFSRNIGSSSTIRGHYDRTGDAILLAGGADLEFGGGPVTGVLCLAKLEGQGVATTDVERQDVPDAGVRLSVSPSPFRSRAVVRYSIPQEGVASVEVFDVGGRRVRSVVPPSLHPAGSYSRTLELGDRTGLMFVRLRAGGRDHVVKVLANH